MEKIRIIIADDHPAFREGLARLLGDDNEMEIVGLAADGVEAVNLSKSLSPDVAILDVSMPKLNGFEATKLIKASSPNTAILMVSAHHYQHYLRASLQSGAVGYLTKDTSLGELITAVQMANTGNGVIGAHLTKSFLKSLVSDKTTKRGNPYLHLREIEVLKLIAKGMRDKEIADKLSISSRTVQSHMANIYHKLNVSSRAEAVLLALKQGLFEMGDLST